MSLAYSGFLDAARMSEGLVVASWGLYLPIAGLCQYCDRDVEIGVRGGESG